MEPQQKRFGRGCSSSCSMLIIIMRIVVAKLLIASYLCFMAFKYQVDPYLSRRMQANIV